jgi:hypothetical protein
MNRPWLVIYGYLGEGAHADLKLCPPDAAMKRSPDPDFVAVFVCQHNLWVPLGQAHFQLCSEHI